MSFTANIVNIHRTIIHVLAFQKVEATFWFFTSLEHHKMKGKEKNLKRGEMDIELLFEVRSLSVQFD